MKLKIPYWPLILGPVFLYYLGAFFNVGVESINHGLMPVQVPFSMIAKDLDMGDTHSVMTAGTHLKFFCDWINIGDGIASPGDLLIWFYQYYHGVCLAIWAALMIRDRNKVKI